jgi:polyphosphate kinase
MSEANRAYQAGDEAALLEVLALWEEGAEFRDKREADGNMPSAQLARLKRRIAEIEAELNRLFGSRLYELFTATNIARRAKRDLLQEMTDRLDADIAAVRGQLG